MHCTHCGKKIDPGSKFCTGCGKTFTSSTPKKKRNYPVRVIVWIIIIGLGAWGWYSSTKNDQAVQTATVAENTYNTSDTTNSTQQTIQQLQTAYNNATDDSTKLEILKDLASDYNFDGDTSQALSTLQQALGYTSQGSSDYYYISGEIAELQVQPATALSDLEQAYQIDPQDSSINNELGLFYLDMGSQWTSYDDNAKALQYSKSAYDLQKNDITAENLAVAYYYNADYQQAISLLDNLDLTNHPSAALWLGYSYAKENDVKNAEFYFQKAIDLGVQVPQEVTNYMNSNN